MDLNKLKQEAEGYTNKLLEDWELYDPEALQEAYIAGAEPREKRIAELEQQIEIMKCCENCNNYCHQIDHRCNTKCKNLSEWEIKENG